MQEFDVSSVIYIYIYTFQEKSLRNNFSGEFPVNFLPNQYLLWETVFLESNWILMLNANLREGSG
jgi:hypothetical protein